MHLELIWHKQRTFNPKRVGSTPTRCTYNGGRHIEIMQLKYLNIVDGSAVVKG